MSTLMGAFLGGGCSCLIRPSRLLADLDRAARAEEGRDADDVPVGEADAAGGAGASDGFGIGSAVHSYAGFIQAAP